MTIQTAISILATVLSTVSTIVCMLALRATYQNGVTDGYGYSKEPNCPGYKNAG